ncbi:MULTISPECIES: hypothetical protein [unclassified Synechocystis]|uniref:hypothetical protein n=1 Tax=unclassified Synechocystis TaxID=2640012 RepID=UPI0004010973|nr:MULTISPECIES: hypothetical protein [unclassified Synechocystis]AIE73876.1 hypothetical protein D082_13480 [Synechocystis sp. PCC 6714]MCT0252313.1 hypothetical protein [Synechocystis sp. CS-94]
MDERQHEHHRQSDEWVKTSLVATVITVVIGVVGFSIQITNLTRVYEQRQTTVEVKLQTLLEDLAELKQTLK